MKLTTGQINGFLQSPPKEMRVIMFYGPDAGLVRERAETMAKKTVPDLQDPFRVALLTGAMVNEDAARLYDEMAAQALGGGRRLVRVQSALDGNAVALGKLLADLPLSDSLLLIEAGDLDKRSKLRALCESQISEAAAVPCYVEDAAQRQRTITDILHSENIEAPRDIAAMLADILPSDRIAMRSELEKLALYIGNTTDSAKRQTLTIEDVSAVIGNAGAAEVDDLIMVVAGEGGIKRAHTLLDHLWAEQTSPVQILRAAQRHFLRLQLARSYMENGLNAGEAVKKLSPPVFWKFVDPMTRQVQRWPSAQIEKVLQRLYDAEAAVKRSGTPDQTLTSQLLLQIGAR